MVKFWRAVSRCELITPASSALLLQFLPLSQPVVRYAAIAGLPKVYQQQTRLTASLYVLLPAAVFNPQRTHRRLLLASAR